MENEKQINNCLLQNFNTKERSSNFSKEENQRLQNLVQKYSHILMCKKTDGTSTKQKEAAWMNIEKEFNALGEMPRSLKQLKYKFENLKRSAKKVATKERQEMRRTGGGKPPSLPPASEDATDWLRSMMSTSIDGNEALYDDDVLSNITKETNLVFTPKLDDNVTIIMDCESTIISTNEEMEAKYVDGKPTKPVETFDHSTPHSSLKRPMASPLKRQIKKKQGENVIKKALQEQKLSILQSLKDIELQKIQQSINQQKELHEQLIKHNEEKHKLELMKLKLEVEILKAKGDKLLV